MAALSDDLISKLLQPYLPQEDFRDATSAGARCVPALSVYLDLLLRWNERTNLTAIRRPEEIVRRHFGESLFAASHLAKRLSPGATVLDFGSGAGFPGLPLQLYLPAVRVTLAESQGKKASFLREAVRTLGLTTELWDQRVEAMPPSRRFDCVTLRAVDRMEAALETARQKTSSPGILAILTTDAERHTDGWEDLRKEVFPMPETVHGELQLIEV